MLFAQQNLLSVRSFTIIFFEICRVLNFAALGDCLVGLLVKAPLSVLQRVYYMIDDTSTSRCTLKAGEF